MTYANLDFLRREERVSISLKALYKSYGYKEFKLSSFDEYSLYADNQSFIGGKDVIAFSAGGKLMALRPDVTLSIIKNGRFTDGTHKLFYDEKVYRKTAGGGFSEVSQIGVEIIGGVDAAAEAELCTLVLKTLAAVGGDYVLDLSHTGIVSKIIQSLNLSAADAAFALRCLESKNVHDFMRFAKSKRLDGQKVNAFTGLMNVPAKDAKRALEEISKTVEISEEIAELDKIITFVGGDKINIDFSIGGDTEYYNGVIFKGYVNGIPHAVLSGGRYDRLLNKFQKGGKATGFALYLGEICRYGEDKPAGPDAVLIYDGENALTALKKAEELRAKGINLLTCKTVPEGFAGKIYFAETGK